MARKRRATSQDKMVEYVAHHKDKRLNIPTAELADFAVKEERAPYILRYPRKPELDPQLVWKGKDEQDGHDLEVPAVPVYIQEHIHPRAIIEDLRREQAEGKPRQVSLFEDFDGIEFSERIDFYRHSQGWSNRMILGDSLLVMASLAEKEGLKGQVQMVYLDPPYGIKFGSNWQVSTRKRDVRDGRAEDATREPEQIRAFRDTWKLGIHSYLAYWRDRLVVARDLLTDTGSIFVQIGDENVHLVRCVMDEVFGSENFVSQISFRTTGGRGAIYIDNVTNFLLWYGKDSSHLKYRRLHLPRTSSNGTEYDWVMLPNGTSVQLTREQLDGDEAIPDGKRFGLTDLTSQGESQKGSYVFRFDGKDFVPRPGRHWSTTIEGLNNLVKTGRIQRKGENVFYRRFADDYPIRSLDSAWDDTAMGGFLRREEKIFVVQTPTRVISRCLLMTTDPGDLVLDPTCVRKGTRVLAPLNPPVNGGNERAPSPLTGRAGVGPPSPSLGKAGAASPSLMSGRVGVGPPSPSTGRVGVGFFPIESLKPGDFVLGHGGEPHRVLRIIRRSYKGIMVGIQHDACPQTLWVTADHRVLCRRRPLTYGAERSWRHVPIVHFQHARALRKGMTPPERRLWSALRGEQLGAKFRRQHPIGLYIADFYSWEAGLVMEVDGDTHFNSEASAYDRERDAYLKAHGLDILRFTNDEVLHQLEGVVTTIRGALQAAQPSEDHYRQWRRADSLQVGDVVYFGPDSRPVEITNLAYEQTEEEVYDLEVEDAHSFITEVCAVHNCGSGTTAYVAEQWGRRWITIDTSRVAIALARTRLMSARFPYYILADTPEGIRRQVELADQPPPSPLPPTEGDIKKGFVYRRVPHVTLKSIANNPDIKEGMTRAEIDAAIARHAESETLYDQPYEENKVVRVTGPFTVESLSPHRVLSAEQAVPKTQEAAAKSAGPGQFETMVLENLKKAGVQQYEKQERIKFDRLEPYAGLYIHGEGEYEGNGQAKRVAVCIGPEHGTVGAELVKEAAKEAVRGIGFDLLIVCGFAFDPHVNEEAKRYGKLKVLSAKINPDLQMGDEFLKRTGVGNLFMVFGEPDIEVKKQKDGKLTVEIKGLDVYDPTTGQVRGHSTDDIACWFIDTDYNDEAFFVRQAYFCGDDEPYDKLKRALKAEIDEVAWASLYSTVSRPFDPPKTGKIAVKVINHYGDEVLKVYQVSQ
ncbi:MAG: DUF559 domain-containing protein [Chloroflexi bacterium]|nr:DUF559 domain-containing protein [Chloroflexota bacterium]MCL5074276.1 DUF559 domain-containing protein [Chloroflexota bacterium]